MYYDEHWSDTHKDEKPFFRRKKSEYEERGRLGVK